MLHSGIQACQSCFPLKITATKTESQRFSFRLAFKEHFSFKQTQRIFKEFHLILDVAFFSPDICHYKKVCPFNGSTPMMQSNTPDFHFSWNQMPNAIGRLLWQQQSGPTLVKPTAWLELAVTVETACATASIQLACVAMCVCVSVDVVISAEGDA